METKQLLLKLLNETIDRQTTDLYILPQDSADTVRERYNEMREELLKRDNDDNYLLRDVLGRIVATHVNAKNNRSDAWWSFHTKLLQYRTLHNYKYDAFDFTISDSFECVYQFYMSDIKNG